MFTSRPGWLRRDPAVHEVRSLSNWITTGRAMTVPTLLTALGLTAYACSLVVARLRPNCSTRCSTVGKPACKTSRCSAIGTVWGESRSSRRGQSSRPSVGPSPSLLACRDPPGSNGRSRRSGQRGHDPALPSRRQPSTAGGSQRPSVRARPEDRVASWVGSSSVGGIAARLLPRVGLSRRKGSESRGAVGVELDPRCRERRRHPPIRGTGCHSNG